MAMTLLEVWASTIVIGKVHPSPVAVRIAYHGACVSKERFVNMHEWESFNPCELHKLKHMRRIYRTDDICDGCMKPLVDRGPPHWSDPT